MALLASCWLIIGSVVIPDGYLKRFYLSFYIHPLLLIFCQVLVWLKFLQRWLLVIFFCLPFRNIFTVGQCIFSFLRRCMVFLMSFMARSFDTEVMEDAVGYEVQQTIDQTHIVGSHSFCNSVSLKCRDKVCDLPIVHIKGTNYKVNSILFVSTTVEEPLVYVNKDLKLDRLSSNCSSILSTEDRDVSPSASSNHCIISSSADEASYEFVPSVVSSNDEMMESEFIPNAREKELDPFYEKYTERMKWFDVLSHERTCGISAILNKKFATPNMSSDSMKAADLSIPYMISCSKTARKRLLASLEGDLQLVYVAQSCLSWEALLHQYGKVEALTCSTSQNVVFYHNVAERFQKFQILLERFMEEERCEGKRYWNYVRKRFSQKILLQVPEVSGYMEEANRGLKGDAMKATEVLKVVEKCIKAFWLYIKTDKKTPCLKFKSLLLNIPPVEDPRDSELLAVLTRTLHKKELWLKDIQGKKRCWLRKVGEILGESQKKDLLFTVIDLKLIARVLKLPVISTSQLQWCQEKLSNIEFRKGQIMRTLSGPLFPSS